MNFNLIYDGLMKATYTIMMVFAGGLYIGSVYYDIYNELPQQVSWFFVTTLGFVIIVSLFVIFPHAIYTIWKEKFHIDVQSEEVRE